MADDVEVLAVELRSEPWAAAAGFMSAVEHDRLSVALVLAERAAVADWPAVRALCEPWVDLRRAGRLGFASRSRLVALDVERVLLTELRDPAGDLYREPTVLYALVVTCRLHPDGWRVAGVGGAVDAPPPRPLAKAAA